MDITNTYIYLVKVKYLKPGIRKDLCVNDNDKAGLLTSLIFYVTHVVLVVVLDVLEIVLELVLIQRVMEHLWDGQHLILVILDVM